MEPNAQQSSRLKFRMVPAGELPPDLIARWSELVNENVGLDSPFFAPEYTAAVASAAPGICVAVAERGGIPVAFLPYQLAPGRIATRLPLCDYQGVIMAEQLELNVKQFLAGCGLRAWDFDHLRSAQRALQLFHRATTESPVMDLQDGFEAYVVGRRAAGTEQIKKNGNLARRLEREVGPLRFEVHLDSPEILRQLLAWRGDKYGSRHPASLIWSILERLLKTESLLCRGTLSVLFAGHELVAAHFGLRSRETWHYWFPAYDPRFEKYSPGITLLLRMAEKAPSLGIKTIDLGSGAMDYKRRLANGAISIAQGSVEVSPVLCLARALKHNARKCLDRAPALRSFLRGVRRSSQDDHKQAAPARA